MKEIFLESENKASPVFILIPGGPGLGHEYFEPFFPELSKLGSILSYTPGTSLNSFSLADFADELELVVRRFSDRKVVFVGHSFGSAIALAYAAKFNLSADLVLISWIYDDAWVEEFNSRTLNALALEQEIAKANSQTSDEALRYRNSMLGYVDLYFPESTRELGRHLFSRISYFPSIREKADSLSTFDGLGILSRLTGRVQSVVGEMDRVVYPEYSARGAEVNPRIRQTLIKNAGHFPFLDQPGRIREILAGP